MCSRNPSRSSSTPTRKVSSRSLRDPDTLARVLGDPRNPGLEHRIGGLEKDRDTGHISYDARQPSPDDQAAGGRKCSGIARDIPKAAKSRSRAESAQVAIGVGRRLGLDVRRDQPGRAERTVVEGSAKCRTHSPPQHLAASRRARRPASSRIRTSVLVPELNNGQLVKLLRSRVFSRCRQSLTKVSGQPFRIGELVEAIRRAVAIGEQHEPQRATRKNTHARTSLPIRKCVGVPAAGTTRSWLPCSAPYRV